jgi:long-subunit acyl-CoA synthetase (AMP-forming)
VKKQVEEINRGLARHEAIKKIVLLPKEFSAETGEPAPALEPKRA